MNTKMKSIILRIVTISMIIVMGGMLFSTATESENASAGKLNKAVSKAVRGKWWTQNSSLGYDVRFTSKEIRYYEHDSYKPVNVCKIKKCKKVKQGYLIIINERGNVYSYLYEKNNPEVLTFLCAVNQKQIEGGVGYSGSSSLTKGRWSDNN